MEESLSDIGWNWLWEPSTPTGALVWALGLFVAAVLVSRLLGRLMRRSNWIMGKLGRQVDPTVVRFSMRVKTFLVFLVAGVIWASLVPGLRALVGTLAAGAGITALVVGFAARSTLSNLVSGLSLAVYRPFSIGHTVTMDNEYGIIEDITLRHTIMRTWEGKRLVIPNEKIDSMTIVNHTIVDPRILCRIELGVSYDTDIDLARRLMLEEVERCPHRMPPETAPEAPRVRVINWADSSIIMRIYAWTHDSDEAWACRFWLMEQVKKRFDAEGVEIPFPYRTVVYKKDLPPAPSEKPENPPEQKA